MKLVSKCACQATHNHCQILSILILCDVDANFDWQWYVHESMSLELHVNDQFKPLFIVILQTPESKSHNSTFYRIILIDFIDLLLNTKDKLKRVKHSTIRFHSPAEYTLKSSLCCLVAKINVVIKMSELLLLLVVVTGTCCVDNVVVVVVVWENQYKTYSYFTLSILYSS